jgi:hypothetical protein
VIFCVVNCVNFNGLLGEEGEPGVLGGDECLVDELEGSGVVEGQVVGAGVAFGAVLDADDGADLRGGAAEVEAAMDLQVAGGAGRAGDVTGLVEAEAGLAGRAGALDQGQGLEPLGAQGHEHGLAGARGRLVRGAGLALGDQEAQVVGEGLEAQADAAGGGVQLAEAADLEAAVGPADQGDRAGGGAVGGFN